MAQAIRRRKEKTQSAKTGLAADAAEMDKGKAKEKSLTALLKARSTFGSDFVLALATTFAMGMAFGFAMNKSRVFEPLVIAAQFKFTNFIMLKMFLAAAAMSCFCLALMSAVTATRWKAARAKYTKFRNLRSTLVGGLLLGAGMAAAGACPGMVLIQVGSGVPNALMTVCGCLAGAFLFGILDPIISPYLRSVDFHPFANEIVHANYAKAAIALGIVCTGIGLLLEYVFPWRSELTNPLSADECLGTDLVAAFNCKSWPPLVGGAVIGTLQLPCVFVLGKVLGGSSSYLCATGQWLRLCPPQTCDRYAQFKGKLDSWWQVAFVCFAICGSYAAVLQSGGSAYVWKETYDAIEGFSAPRAFFGGVVMVFGARVAKGCPSGHGLSGMAMLATSSLLAVPTMFAGGALAAFLLEYL